VETSTIGQDKYTEIWKFEPKNNQLCGDFDDRAEQINKYLKNSEDRKLPIIA
jgi:hypothetical protein